MAIKRHEVIEVDINKVKPNIWNPNEMDSKTTKQLEMSVDIYGEVLPIIVDEQMMIIDGEHRWQVMKLKNQFTCKVVIVEGLTEDQKKDLSLTLNKVRGINNPDKLAIILDELKLTDDQIVMPFDRLELGIFSTQDDDMSIEENKLTDDDTVQEDSSGRIIQKVEEPTERQEVRQLKGQKGFITLLYYNQDERSEWLKILNCRAKRQTVSFEMDMTDYQGLLINSSEQEVSNDKCQDK